ncbi:MAG: DUF2335 domain-containing protein [Rhodobacteraceae bacterium]|nr:DUF2335 domain-containing protein [Paracoccaceae bacterium]
MPKQPKTGNSRTGQNPPLELPGAELEAEIDRQLGDLIPRETRGEVSRRVSTVLLSERFSGPIPHPKHLGEYESVMPGAADRIISMAESHLEHRQTMERATTEAEIRDTRRGMFLGCSALMMLVAAAFASAVLLESDVVPGLFLGTAALGSVGMFIKGRQG